ncbi:KINESIN-4-LIKE ISOFORM X1 [Salix purpurea]|uniref:KINESIN-4-LIKE ISOFORM X1 n=1 Tax=Salix purpurea TaxID=77065 RepID=A0A9Q0T9E4_SALPP|nr:KINESIN-4-LIKE ISOFORM X1 [Salix purpurea]
MGVSPERSLSENGRYDSSNGAHADVNIQSVIEWLNRLLPHLNLSSDASEEKLRAYLIDGTVLCNILDKLCPGLVEMGGNSEPGPENIRKFLAAMDEMALPRFVLADIQEGYMEPVLQCLGTLKTHFEFTGGKESIHEHLRRRWNLPKVEVSEGITSSLVYTATCDENPAIYGDERRQNSFENKYGSILDDSFSSESAALAHDAGHKLSEMSQQKQGSYADLSDSNILELMNSNGFDNASTRTLFSLVSRILEENIERKNGHVHHMAHIVKKAVQVIEHRVSTQAVNLKDLNILHEVHLGKCHSRIKVLETLAAGTTEEIQVLLSQLKQIKIEKTKIEEKKRLEEQELLRIKQEKIHSDIENSTLKHELEITKTAHEEHCLLLQMQAEETKVQLEKKLKEFDFFLTESKKRVKELESFSESKYQRWKSKEGTYRSFIDHQFRALQELRGASDSLKHEILKTKRSYAEEFNFLGVKLKGLVDAAANYHSVLAENRRLYNEVQDLKGNIRVYCRIRPFLPGQSKKRTTVEYIGENGELVISNPSKPGKDSHRLFKFNKVFGPAATQVTSTADVLELMNIGLMNRAVGATVLNERSSRSHSVLTVHVQGMDLKTSAVLRGNLHLVDLAGSERVDRSEVVGERLREAQHINKSLSALGDVIFSLSQKSQHVPFRNSKLTQVLQSSLGGQAKTLMFVQLNPDVDSYSETISTLKFAERVSGIELGAAKSNNEGRNIRELMEQVAFLKDTISRKDEVIERLQQLKVNANGVKCGMNSLRYDSSPRRYSNGTARHSPRLLGREGSRLFEEASSDTDNCSEHSERRSEAGSAQSMDDFQHHKMLLPQSKSMDDLTLKKEFAGRPNFVGTYLSQNDKEDLDLLGFGDADSDERLSDISDGCLSRAETEASLSSAVEFTLFPESKPSEAAKPVGAAKPARKAADKKPSFISRLPKPSQKLEQTRLPRLSTTISPASKASSSMSAARKPPASSFSASKPVKRWH